MANLGNAARRWPNPEESTGELYKNVKLGRKQCWEARGDARKEFEDIASEIKSHLEKCGEPVAHPVVWTIYMIGRSREESAPTIMFCGRDKKALTEIKGLIKNSGIMDRYPGFRMGSRTEEFRHYARGKSRKRHKRRRPNVRPCSGSPESHKTHIGAPVGAGEAIFYSPLDTGPGMRIFIQGFHGDSSIWRKATGGGFICHQGSTFLTTVAHAFRQDDVNALQTSPDNCNIEFELDGDSGDDDESSSRYSFSVAPSESSDLTISGGPFSDTTSETSNSIIFGRTFSDTTSEVGTSPTIFSAEASNSTILGGPFSDTTSEASNSTILGRTFSGGNWLPELNSMARAQKRESSVVVKSKGLHLPVGEHYILSTTGSRPDLDYCLIEIETNDLLKSKRIPLKLEQPAPNGAVMREPSDVDVVVAVKSGGLLKGRLSGTPSFLMLPGRNLVQEVWTVRYGTEICNETEISNDREIPNGDCGAWVVDASNGDLFGHIVGGSPSSGVSYIIPAYLIIKDLEERFDGEWKPAGVVPGPVVPGALATPGESKLRRSWYLK